MKRSEDASIRYRIDASDVHAHLFRVQLHIAHPQPRQMLSLPAWIPGSYLVREFTRHLQHLQARQGGRKRPVEQADKSHWVVQCDPEQPLMLSYEVYALDASVRTAWLDSARAFFNGTSLCLRVHGQEDQPHELELLPVPAEWRWEAHTGLSAHRVNARGFGTYRARDYDELVDCPVEVGAHWSADFEACGVPHRFVISGATDSLDGERLIAHTRRICEQAIRMWHGRRKPPIDRYLFLLHVVHDGYGGLEHRNSTALIASRKDLPRLGDERQSEGYTTLLGLISHEYFHTWNVKRLRPAEFTRYDYTQENYTRLLWFFEGFTSYYDDLLLRRAGLIDDNAYLRLLNKTINQVDQTPGRLVQSVADASFDAWVKYYRQDENTPNATVSYYTKGALVGLCLDLALRAEGRTSLDAVMRELWKRCAGGPMREQDLLDTLAELSGRAWNREVAQWVHSTAELPLADLLLQHGVVAVDEPAQWQQRLGLRCTESDHRITVKSVLRGGAAEQAGMSAGDEWIGIEVQGRGWRLGKVDELALYTAGHKRITVLVSRDQRLLRFPLAIPAQVTTRRLVLRDAAKASHWLAGG
jgi:predicted metalloprotease with PDZ domain